MNAKIPAAPASSNARNDLDTLLDQIADRIAERVIARIARDPAEHHATAKNNPIGTPRAFLDAGRRGDFPTFKKGREVAARWCDVTAYIERRTCERKPRTCNAPATPANANATPLDPRARRLAQLAGVGALPHDRTESEASPGLPRRRGA